MALKKPCHKRREDADKQRAKDILDFGELLLEVATGFACHHVGFRLPRGYRDSLACVAVCQHKPTFKSFLLLGG